MQLFIIHLLHKCLALSCQTTFLINHKCLLILSRPFYLFLFLGITIQHDSSRNNSRDDDLVFLDRALEKIEERQESESESEEAKHDVTTEESVTGTN